MKIHKRYKKHPWIEDVKNQILYIPLVNQASKLTGYAKVALKDKDFVLQYCYSCTKTVKTIVKEYAKANNRKTLHELLIGKAPEGYQIDHINHDGLDDRRSNLRHITNAAQ